MFASNFTRDENHGIIWNYTYVLPEENLELALCFPVYG